MSSTDFVLTLIILKIIIDMPLIAAHQLIQSLGSFNAMRFNFTENGPLNVVLSFTSFN